MLNLPARLRERERPVRVGVIGAGLFGTNVAWAVERAPGMEVAAVADIDPERVDRAYRTAGVDPGSVTAADDAEAATGAIEAGERAHLDDGLELARAGVDVVVEATGVPSAAARHAHAAITEGRHVVMVTVEADSVVGPTLADLADSRGVAYSMAYGDQPALIVELVDWAETVGLEVVAAGKGNASRPEDRHGTPDDIFERYGFDPEFVEDRGLNPRMYNSFREGTKAAVEMCAVANATGLTPDVPGMHMPVAEIPEIPDLLRPEADGGLLSGPGAVETVRTLREDGTPVERSIGFGMFVVVRAPDDYVRRYLDQYAGTGFHVVADGEYAVFYRPHHLPGLETTVSIASAAVRGEPTGTPRAREAEVVGAAKRDLEPGEEIDGGGGYTVYGRLEAAADADENGYVPFELLEGAEMLEPVAQDEVLTYDDVSLEESFLYHLRHVQDGL